MQENIIDYKKIINSIKPEIEKSFGFLQKELAKIKTGRATPALVENIIIDCFGQKFPLKQLAAISIPESRQILIQPWDVSYIEPIILGITKADNNMFPIVDKNTIKIVLPVLTEEYRKDLLRHLSQKQEEVRKTIRKWRENAWKEIQEKTRLGKIREDDKFKAKDELQELIDEYNKKIEELGEKKEKELFE